MSNVIMSNFKLKLDIITLLINFKFNTNTNRL